MVIVMERFAHKGLFEVERGRGRGRWVVVVVAVVVVVVCRRGLCR